MLLKALLDILFPPLCHVCRTFIPDAGDVHLCAGCTEKIRPLISPLCKVCGAPFLTEGGMDHACGGCITEPPRFAGARAAALFDGPVKELIHGLKYAGTVRFSRPLGLITAHRLAPFAAELSPDLIVPVPLHIKRLRQRGFNQSVLLAGILAGKWGLPLVRNNLRRIRWTEPQINLPADERRRNVRGAFALHDPAGLKGKRVLLVDDVFTTGSTVNECTRVLKRAGADGVFVVTVARAL